MIEKVPWVTALAVAPIALLTAALVEVEASLRIAAIAAVAGVINLLSLRFVGGRGLLATPSSWTKRSFVTGACIGFSAGLVSIAPLDLLGNAACFGTYAAASHWLVRSVIDNSEDINSAS